MCPLLPMPAGARDAFYPVICVDLFVCDLSKLIKYLSIPISYICELLMKIGEMVIQ